MSWLQSLEMRQGTQGGLDHVTQAHLLPCSCAKLMPFARRNDERLDAVVLLRATQPNLWLERPAQSCGFLLHFGNKQTAGELVNLVVSCCTATFLINKKAASKDPTILLHGRGFLAAGPVQNGLD